MSTGYTRRTVFAADLVSGEMETPQDPISPPAPRHSRILVRLHHHPIGTINVDNVSNGIPTIKEVRNIAFDFLADAIEQHLTNDGLAVPSDATGLADLPAADSCRFDLASAASEEPLMTVVVTTMNNAIACAKSVQRILDGSYENIDVVVVDNQPEVGNTRAVMEAKFGDRVRYVAQPRRGLSRARNKGLEVARGKFVSFIDDDVIVDRHWLRAIAHTYAGRPEVACVTGPIAAAELDSPAQALLEQYGGFNKGSRRQVYDLDENKRDTPLYPFDSGRFGSGANISIRASVARALGGFAEDLGAGTPAHGGEDIDILRRIVSSGHTLIYEPAALMWHFHRRSYRALEKQMFRYGVGFSATVMKWIMEGPSTTFAIVRRLPAGFRHVLSPKSDKNKRKTLEYPRMLTILERVGILLGPVLYLKSRFAKRRGS